MSTHCFTLLAIASLAALVASPSGQAASPSFPWHGTSALHRAQPAVGSVPAQVLSQPATTPLQTLSPRQAYPYGYFGSNPTPQWKRSFGVSKAYTQWSR